MPIEHREHTKKQTIGLLFCRTYACGDYLRVTFAPSQVRRKYIPFSHYFLGSRPRLADKPSLSLVLYTGSGPESKVTYP